MQDLHALQNSVQTRLNESLTIPSVNKSPQYSRSSLKEREKGIYKTKEREKGVYKIKERERDVNKVKEREKGVSLYRNSLLSQPMDVNYSHLYPSLSSSSSSYIDHHRVEEVPNLHHHSSIPAMKDDDYIEPYDRVARSYSSVTNSLQDPINLSQSIELPPSGKGSRPDVATDFGSFRPGVASEFGSFRPTLQSTGNNTRGNSPDYNSKIINSIQPPTTTSSSSTRYGLINNPHSTSFKSNVTSTTLSPPAVFSINKPPQSIPIHVQVQSLHPNSNTINNNNTTTTTTIPNNIVNSSPNSVSALPIAVASLTTLKNTANKSTSSSALSIKKSSLGGSKTLPRKPTISNSNNNYKGKNINKGSSSGVNTTSNQITKRSPTFITALTTTSSVDDNMMMSDEEERRSSSVSPDSINHRRMKNKVEPSSDISISSDNE